MDEWRRSGQIPTFGNWDQANELPITQYFECARQAGLVRYSNSSGECDLYVRPPDLYSSDFIKPPRYFPHPRKTTRMNLREKRGSGGPHPQKKAAGKVCDVTEPPRKQQQQQQQQKQNMKPISHVEVQVQRPITTIRRPPKPVDEDLYKIPPHLLRSSKRNKRPGFFSCLVPACAS